MPSLTLSEFADKIGEIMPVISSEFFKHQSHEFYKMKITLPQFVILDVLNRHDEAKMTEIANFMHVTTAAMTGIIDRLVKGGFVKRISDPLDRRIIKIKLTAKGASIVKDAIEHRKNMISRLFGMISQAEREAYLKILTRIRDRLKEEDR